MSDIGLNRGHQLINVARKDQFPPGQCKALDLIRGDMGWQRQRVRVGHHVHESGPGVALAAYLLFKKLVLHREIIAQNGPLLFAVTLLILSGIQLLCLGLASEILSRTYYESQGKPIYAVGEIRRHEPYELLEAPARVQQKAKQLLATYDLAAFNLQD